MVKLARIKPWIHHTRVKQAQEEQRRPQAINLCAPGGTISSQGGIPATVFPGETVCPPGHRWRNYETAVFIWLTSFLNSKTLTYTFLLLIKRVGLKWNLRSVRAQTHRLLRSPALWIKRPQRFIQSLSPLTGSGRGQAARLPAYLVSQIQFPFSLRLPVRGFCTLKSKETRLS